MGLILEENGENCDVEKGDTVTIPERKGVTSRDLFRYATGVDRLILVLGSLGAVGTGLGRPIMVVIFGRVLDTLNTNILSVVGDSVMYFVFLAAGVMVATFFQV